MFFFFPKMNFILEATLELNEKLGKLRQSFFLTKLANKMIKTSSRHMIRNMGTLDKIHYSEI